MLILIPVRLSTSHTADSHTPSRLTHNHRAGRARCHRAPSPWPLARSPTLHLPGESGRTPLMCFFWTLECPSTAPAHAHLDRTGPTLTGHEGVTQVMRK